MGAVTGSSGWTGRFYGRRVSDPFGTSNHDELLAFGDGPSRRAQCRWEMIYE